MNFFNNVLFKLKKYINKHYEENFNNTYSYVDLIYWGKC